MASSIDISTPAYKSRLLSATIRANWVAAYNDITALQAAVAGLPAYPLSTANGGLGADNSASSGVPLFAAGAVTMTGTSGTGNFARVTSPTFVTPTLGVAGATSINGLTISASTGTLVIANSKTLTASNSLTLTGTDGASVNFGAGGTVLYGGGSYVSSLAGTANQITASAATGAVTLSLPAAVNVSASVAIGGATIGSNALAWTGTAAGSGKMSLGGAGTTAALNVRSNAEQLRLEYDASKYTVFGTDITGSLYLNSVPGDILLAANSSIVARVTSTGLNDAAIGATTASTGKFTALTVGSSTYPTAAGSSGNVLTSNGTNWVSSAPASGPSPTLITSKIQSGSATSLTTGTAKTVTSINLPAAGTYNIWGNVGFTQSGGTTVVTGHRAGISSATNTFPTDVSMMAAIGYPSGGTPGANTSPIISIPIFQVTVGTATDYFLVAIANFTVSDQSAFGSINAQRVA